MAICRVREVPLFKTKTCINMAITKNLLRCVSVLWELPELGMHTWIMGLCAFAAAKLGVQKPLVPRSPPSVTAL